MKKTHPFSIFWSSPFVPIINSKIGLLVNLPTPFWQKRPNRWRTVASSADSAFPLAVVMTVDSLNLLMVFNRRRKHLMTWGWSPKKSQPIFHLSQETNHKQANRQAQCFFFFFQKVLDCEVCKLTKTSRAPCRNRQDARGDLPFRWRSWWLWILLIFWWFLPEGGNTWWHEGDLRRRVNRSSTYRKRPTTSKPTGRHNVFFFFFKKFWIVTFASSRKLPELRAGTARMREETVFITLQKKRDDVITADRNVFNTVTTSLVCSIVSQSWYRTFMPIGSTYIPDDNKSAQETVNSLPTFVPLDQKSGLVHKRSFTRIYQCLWRLVLASRETNGIAEHAVSSVKEGTSALLAQSGLPEKWWREAMECLRYLWNIQDKLVDRKSPYERRFGTPFDGPIIPFGAGISVNLVSTKDKSRLHQFGTQEYSSDAHCIL